MATARLDMRLSKSVKVKVEKASALRGYKSLTDYVVRTLDEDASRTIEEYAEITLQEDLFDSFWAACEKADAPNAALTAAVKFSEENGY